MANFQNKQPTFTNGQVINSGNYGQLQPNTPIAVGVTGLVINGGNFINCLLPPDTVKNSGNFCTKDYCAHLHPEWDLPAEDDDCRHVVDTIEVDDVIIDYVREDIANG